MRKSSVEVLRIASAIAVAIALWSALTIFTRSSYPILTVSSESMEPTFYRGDIILLSNRRQRVVVGDIPVLWFAGRPLPMVHRAIEVLDQAEGNADNATTSQLILTKGDNNGRDDGLSSLYPAGRKYARRDEVVGLVYGKVPYLGQFSLLAREKPWVLCAAIASILAVGRAL
ncbi:signal peptidase I [Corynespora cassiicola Philippines]|uniref:Signal peptidase complex catalytic subunit SEC11 n=1 Tax=Corynespora cassiicola Philippines TaxID=1448308 RepID=A0A2T2NCW3_CORCC|nr:signal peptidase I [Corynespora cassiicola Philippines]